MLIGSSVGWEVIFHGSREYVFSLDQSVSEVLVRTLDCRLTIDAWVVGTILGVTDVFQETANGHHTTSSG